MAESRNVGRRDSAKEPAGNVTAKSAESKQLVAANSRRNKLIITNNGAAQAVWLSLGGAAAVAEKGIRLNKESAPLVLEGYTGAVQMITKEGESVVSFSEI